MAKLEYPRAYVVSGTENRPYTRFISRETVEVPVVVTRVVQGGLVPREFINRTRFGTRVQIPLLDTRVRRSQGKAERIADTLNGAHLKPVQSTPVEEQWAPGTVTAAQPVREPARAGENQPDTMRTADGQTLYIPPTDKRIERV